MSVEKVEYSLLRLTEQRGEGGGSRADRKSAAIGKYPAASIQGCPALIHTLSGLSAYRSYNYHVHVTEVMQRRENYLNTLPVSVPGARCKLWAVLSTAWLVKQAC